MDQRDLSNDEAANEGALESRQRLCKYDKMSASLGTRDLLERYHELGELGVRHDPEDAPKRLRRGV